MQISQRNIFLYNSSQFLFSLVFTIPIWIVYYQTRISVSQISMLIAMQYAAQLFLELPTGAFADIFGRKSSTAFGYLLWAFSYLLIFATSGFSALVFATLLGGVAESFLSGSLEALVFDSLKQDKREGEFSKILSKNGVLFQFGLAISTFAGGFLYSIHWSLPYIACVISNSSAFLLSLWMIEPQIDSVSFTFRNYIRQIKEGSAHAFAGKEVAWMSLFYVCVSAITRTNNLYFFDFMLVSIGLPTQLRGIVGASIRIFNVVILSTLLKNEKLFTRKRSIYFFPILMILCFLPGVLYTGWWAVPFIAGSVMAGTARWIILTKYTNEMFESKYRATAISALSMLIGILFVAITFISGPIIERFGVQMMYTLLGIATVFFVVPLSFVVARKQSRK